MGGKGGALAGLDLNLKLTQKQEETRLTAEDWRNRGKRREYEAAVEEMLDRTDHAAAPWVLVEAEDKRWTRVKVAESVVSAIETGLAALNIRVPPAAGARLPSGINAL